MAVFKRKYTARNGKTTLVQKYSVDFRNHKGIVRRVSAFTDKSASVELERQLKKLVALRMTGARPDAEFSLFIEACPVEIRERLGEWGIIEMTRVAAGKDIAVHISAWQAAMTAKGITQKQNNEAAGKIKRLASACGWRSLSDVTATSMDKWRNEQKAAGKASMTLNHYLTVAKTFCNWLLRERRISENPLEYLSKLNAAADRRLERHPYTVEELGRLLATAESGGVHHGMTGYERALLYRLAAETGFRWSELRSLTRASFDFTGDIPTVTIDAAYAKNGKTDTLTLRPELAADLKAHTALFLPMAKLFPGMGEKGAEMIRADLEAAGILARNAEGVLNIADQYGLVYDFHGLRHTFATMLNKAGVPLATAQKLMRHSDPKLTANIYTHIMVETKAEALAKLPTIAAAITAERETATGTGETVVMPVDSFATDLRAKITTYNDDGKGANALIHAPSKNEKPLVPQGLTRGGYTGAAYPIRTGDLRFTKPLLYH